MEEEYITNGTNNTLNNNLLVSGHQNCITYYDDYILKKTNKSEIEFYNYLNSVNCSLQMEEMKNFIPKFFGTKIINEQEYLMIENLHNGIEAFNNMDCKLGRITWNKKTSIRKIEKRKKMYYESTTHLVGFRIIGAILRNKNGEISYKISKKEVSDIINTKEHLKDFFKSFITFEDKLNKEILLDIIKELEKMINFFKIQNEKSFICTSIYYVVGRNNKTNIKLIDFAIPGDSFEYDKIDENLLEALEENLKIWNSLL